MCPRHLGVRLAYVLADAELWSAPMADELHTRIASLEQEVSQLRTRVAELERLVLVTPPAPPPVDVSGELRAALERLDVPRRQRFLVAEAERVAPPGSPLHKPVDVARRFIAGHATQTELGHAEERASAMLNDAIEAHNATNEAHHRAIEAAMKSFEQTRDSHALDAAMANDPTAAAATAHRIANLVWTVVVAVDPELGAQSLDLVVTVLAEEPGVLERVRALT